MPTMPEQMAGTTVCEAHKQGVGKCYVASYFFFDTQSCGGGGEQEFVFFAIGMWCGMW